MFTKEKRSQTKVVVNVISKIMCGSHNRITRLIVCDGIRTASAPGNLLPRPDLSSQLDVRGSVSRCENLCDGKKMLRLTFLTEFIFCCFLKMFFFSVIFEKKYFRLYIFYGFLEATFANFFTFLP
jgi:hypothetical protein